MQIHLSRFLLSRYEKIAVTVSKFSAKYRAEDSTDRHGGELLK